MVVDVTGQRPRTWPNRWKPRGYGSSLEPFRLWWLRNRRNLPMLDRRVAEQWLHRHWRYTRYSNLSVHQYSCTHVLWPARWVLSKVGHVSGLLEPAWDYAQLRRTGTPPASVMNALGTWDYPIVLMYSPRGFITERGIESRIRYWLIEGHLRFRYLNALEHQRVGRTRHHAVFILHRPDARLAVEGALRGPILARR